VMPDDLQVSVSADHGGHHPDRYPERIASFPKTIFCLKEHLGCMYS
jgi:hypothetical protein